MDSGELAEDVRELLRRHIESYEHLETLVRLHSEPNRQWVAGNLSPSPQHHERMAEILELFRGSGIVRLQSADAGSGYVYDPVSPALDAAVSSLVREYREQPTAVIRFMSANAIRRLRTGAARAFCDALIPRRK